jgi:hypothetical protein
VHHAQLSEPRPSCDHSGMVVATVVIICSCGSLSCWSPLACCDQRDSCSHYRVASRRKCCRDRQCVYRPAPVTVIPTQPVVMNTATGERVVMVQSKIASCNKVSMPFGSPEYIFFCDHKYPTRDHRRALSRTWLPGHRLRSVRKTQRFAYDYRCIHLLDLRNGVVLCFTAFSPTSLSLGDPSKITINVVPGTTAKLFLAFLHTYHCDLALLRYRSTLAAPNP